MHAPFGPLDDAQWRHLAETSARPGPAGGLALHFDPAIAVPIVATEPADIDIAAFWAAVSAPTLLIRGADSDLLLAATARAMAARPGIELAEIQGCGHAPALMAPDQIGLVTGFLAG